jgi:hypothetical protein
LGYASPDASFAGYQVGSTYYDYQHNSTMGRQIAVGADGRVHVDWMFADNGVTFGPRYIYYNSMLYNISVPVGWATTGGFTGDPITPFSGSGYCQMGVWGDRGVAAYHMRENGTGTYHSWAGFSISGGGSASFNAIPAPDSACPYTPTGDYGNEYEFIWPILDVEDHGATATVHMASTEYDSSFASSLVYFRAEADTSFSADMFGDCGVWIDSVVQPSAVVCADRNSDNVAVVYSTNRYWYDPDPWLPGLFSGYNDVWYRESTDDGLSFGPIQTVTDTLSFPDEDSLFALADLSALYDADGDLHVVWIAGMEWPDPDSDTLAYYYPQYGKMFHWDKNSGAVTLIVTGDNVHSCGSNNASPGANCRNVCKPDLVQGDNGNLYVTYTWFKGDVNDTTDDCSANNYANGDLYAQASQSGITWGPPVNLTNTRTDGCTAGDCMSEHWPTSAAYADSLYILYIGDKDPGGAITPEGTPQNDPVMVLINELFPMETFVELSVDPEGFIDPFHRAPGESYDTSFVITNLGNAQADCQISENPAVGWLAVAPTNPSIQPAVNNEATIDVSGTAPGSQGLYQTTIVIDFNDSKGQIVMPVDFYVFNDFFIPENATIRTAQNRLNVSQDSRVGDQEAGAQMTWFSDNSNYLYDGSLIIGYNADNMFTNIFYQDGDTAVADNPLRELRALSHTTYDSTSFASYRYAEGTGCTADSTVAFHSQFYAPTHPDSANFYVGRFSLYAGPNTPVGTPVTGLIVGYATDWDIPSDSSSDNYGGYNDTLQLVYQQGAYIGSPDGNEYRYGGIAYRGNDSTYLEAENGWYWQNQYYVYPNPTNLTGGYQADSLYHYMTTVTTWGPQPFPSVKDSVDDLNSVITVSKNATLTWSGSTPDSMIFYIIFAGSNDDTGPKSVADLKTAVRKGQRFICNHLNEGGPGCCDCGDADGNGIVNISDAVYLIAYIFGGGDPPDPLCNGDADGNNIVNISDAVYLIAYIFGGGDPPHCP